MALSYQWKWQRGQRLTAKFNNGTTALGETFAPVILSSNLLELPTAGAELLGVVEANAGASETGVAVIVSDDIFEVQVKTGANLALGDAVAAEADGSVDAAGAGESVCGHVVDYDPASGGIAHIKASFGGLRAALGGEEILAILAAENDGTAGADKIGATPITGVGTANTDTVQEILEALKGLDDLKLPLAGGTLSGDVTMTDGEHVILGTTTGSKIGTAVAQKLGFWNAAPVVQPAGAAQAEVTAASTNGTIAGLTFSAQATQAECEALRNACETVGDDVRAAIVLVNALRTALVDAGIIKGAA